MTMFMRAGILAAGLLLAACGTVAPANEMDMAGTPADLDYAAERLSDQGLFAVSYGSDLDPISINEVHAWTLHVETADGQPVDGATIAVKGGMPEHNHGMPTQPEVTENPGAGDYRVEGMKFQMPGWWTITFAIEAGSQQDTVTFNLNLQPQ